MQHTIVPFSLFLSLFSGCERDAEASSLEPPTSASEPSAEPTIPDHSAGVTLTVNVRGLRNTSGGMLAYLHGSKDTFPRKFDQAVRKERRRTLKATTATLRFTNVKPGTYALVIVHDENGNGKIDKNLLGMPKEGIGVTGVDKGRPNWSVAKFEVSADRAVRVSMQYF